MKQIKALVVYLLSPKGKAQIHAAITSLLAIYIALHRAGA